VAKVGNAPLFFFLTFDNGALYYAKRHLPHYDTSLLKPEVAYFLLMQKEKWDEIAARNEANLVVVDVSEGTGPKDRHRLALVQAPQGTPVVGEQTAPVEEDEQEEDTL